MKRTFLKTVAVALASWPLAVLSRRISPVRVPPSPSPMYAKWAEAYKKTGTGLNYQSIGSSGGIRQIRAKTVAFGASMPVPGADLDKDGMVQFPAIIGGTVPVINLDGFKPGELRVTGPVLAEIFLGKIAKWNDAKLAALNPGKTLPDQSITVVHRADGSGTTFNWTDYLSAVSKEWADSVGKGAAVKWRLRRRWAARATKAAGRAFSCLCFQADWASDRAKAAAKNSGNWSRQSTAFSTDHFRPPKQQTRERKDSSSASNNLSNGRSSSFDSKSICSGVIRIRATKYQRFRFEQPRE